MYSKVDARELGIGMRYLVSYDLFLDSIHMDEPLIRNDSDFITILQNRCGESYNELEDEYFSSGWIGYWVSNGEKEFMLGWNSDIFSDEPMYFYRQDAIQ